MTVTDENGNKVKYTYDGKGNLTYTMLLNPIVLISYVSYDGLYRKLYESVYFDKGKYVMTYYQYDNLSRVVNTTMYDKNGSLETENTTYTYNGVVEALDNETKTVDLNREYDTLVLFSSSYRAGLMLCQQQR